MVVSFAPTVMVDGGTVTPEGWMWVLALAMGGCQWAIDECENPEFDLPSKMRDYERRRKIYLLNVQIEEVEKRLENLRLERDSITGG